MNKADEYTKLLQHPKWKRKRKAIKERDGFKCTVCGATEDLIVHHTYYLNNFPPPWKYPNKSLLTLCERCHHEFHEHHETPLRSCVGERCSKKQGRIYIAGNLVRKKHPKIKAISLAEMQEERGLRIKRRAL